MRHRYSGSHECMHSQQEEMSVFALTGPPRISTVERGAWEKLLADFPQHTVFHRFAWLQSVAEAYRAEVVLARADTGDRCVGVWPCLEQRKGPFRILGSPLPGWSTLWMGPLFAPGADALEVARAFLSDRTFSRAAYIFCKVLDEASNVDLATLGFERVRRPVNYVVDLGPSQEELWRHLRKGCRRAIGKARRCGIVVQQEESPGFLDAFWRMAVQVFARSNMHPVYSRRMVECVWRNLRRSESVFALSAVLDGRRIATQILPYDSHTAYAWASAGLEEARKFSGNNILDWETILEAKRRGLKWYDLGSIYGGPGVYKGSFRPEKRARATQWERSRSSLVAMLKRMYESYLRRRLRLK